MASLAGINIRIRAHLNEFSKDMQAASRKFKKFGKEMQKTGRSISKNLSLPIAALGGVSTKIFAEFEQEMAKVKAISGATSEEFSALENNAKLLGRTTRYTAAEVAALQLNYSKLGFVPEEINKVTKSTLDLALATGEDLARSATVAASTLRGFELDASEMQRVVDVMANSFSSSALDLEKFETAMAIVAPVAKNAGIEIEQATAMLSVLTDRGVDASTAGTSLRNIFLTLAKEGMTLDQAFNQIQNSTNKNATALELFGKRGSTAASILSANRKATYDLELAYQSASGSAAEMSGIMDNTLNGALLKVKSAGEGLAIEFGEVLKPVIQKLAESLARIADYFSNLSPEMKKIIVLVAGLAVAIGPLITGLGILVTKIIPLMSAGLTAIKLAMSPVTLTILAVVAAVAALTAAVVGVVKAWDELGTFFKRLWLKIKLYFVEGIKVVMQKFVDFAAFFGVDIANITESLDSFSNKVKEDLDATPVVSFGEAMSVAGDGIVDTFNTAKEAIGDFFSSTSLGSEKVADKVSDSFKKMKEANRDFLVSLSGNKLQSKSYKPGDDNGITIQPRNSGQQVNTSEPDNKITIFSDIKKGAEEAEMAVSDSVQSMTGDFAELLGSAIATGDGFKNFPNMIFTTLADLAIRVGKIAIATAISIEGIKQALQSLNPVAAAVAGVALIAIGTAVKSSLSNSVPAFANGGIVSGPTLAMVGEYPGASNNPEVIAPLNKLKALLPDNSSGGGSVKFEIEGTKLKGVLDRVNTRKGRVS